MHGFRKPVFISSNQRDIDDARTDLFEGIIPKDPKEACQVILGYFGSGEIDSPKLSFESLQDINLSDKRMLVVEDDHYQLKRILRKALSW